MPDELQLLCEDPTRRAILLADPKLNGIDAVEVPWDDQLHPRVYFVKDDLPDLRLEQWSIQGGARITDIAVTSQHAGIDGNGIPYLELTVDKAGDFSVYTLAVDAPGVLDPRFTSKPFSFKAGCPTDFDCEVEAACPPERVDAPVIDYMAKDYASFRRLLLDLATTRVPHWTERHEADLGVALVELLAYVADNLSYYQDAVANEAFLETARQRESVRRHVKLIDYQMHEGANAHAFVHLTVARAGTVPAGTAILTRIAQPVEAGVVTAPGPVIAAGDAGRALAAADTVFQAVEPAVVDPAHNELAIHTWGDTRCCLPRGATAVDLVGDIGLAEDQPLLLEEVKGPVSGRPEDADPGHRQVVRITKVSHAVDPLLTRRRGRLVACPPGEPGLPVTRVEWDRADALTFPLCLSAELEGGTVADQVSVARGNLILADHGAAETEDHPVGRSGRGVNDVARRFRLRNGPLTFRARAPAPSGGGRHVSVAELAGRSPRGADPQVRVRVVVNDVPGPEWTPRPDLLNSDAFASDFVVEMGGGGRALLRFGKDGFGRELPDSTPDREVKLRVAYRVGNGAAGNVGRDTLAHVVVPDPTPRRWPVIEAVRNPLPGFGGVDPEGIEQVKRTAPAAFHAEPLRAVTEADYARAAERRPEISRATASLRWTGSWYTVFVALDPAGADRLDPALEQRVRAFLTGLKQAGCDLEIDPPTYVPLEVAIRVCVAPDHFAGHVRRAVLDVLSNRVLPDGRKGFFHPDNFTFSQPVHLSRLYAALAPVTGVDSAEVVTFKRFGREPAGELEQARIDLGRLEVARLDNDPNAPENGLLALTMLGGK
jgi:hypothetical protein